MASQSFNGRPFTGRDEVSVEALVDLQPYPALADYRGLLQASPPRSSLGSRSAARRDIYRDIDLRLADCGLWKHVRVHRMGTVHCADRTTGDLFEQRGVAVDAGTAAELLIPLPDLCAQRHGSPLKLRWAKCSHGLRVDDVSFHSLATWSAPSPCLTAPSLKSRSLLAAT